MCSPLDLSRRSLAGSELFQRRMDRPVASLNDLIGASESLLNTMSHVDSTSIEGIDTSLEEALNGTTQQPRWLGSSRTLTAGEYAKRCSTQWRGVSTRALR